MRYYPSRTATRGGMLRKKSKRGWRRGVELIEFALILPIFLVIITFAIDMGNVVFISGTLHDAVYTAARTGSQVGEAGVGESGPSWTAFTQAIDGIPGGNLAQVKSYSVIDGSVCTTNAPNNYVVIQASYQMHFITPGLYSLLSIVAGQGWTLGATGVARCEVVRG